MSATVPLPYLKLRLSLLRRRLRAQRERLGLLRGVTREPLVVGVDLELLRHRLAELRLREHALDGQLDDALGVARELVFDRDRTQAARVERVVVVHLLVVLRALEDRLLGVDDDDV